MMASDDDVRWHLEGVEGLLSGRKSPSVATQEEFNVGLEVMNPLPLLGPRNIVRRVTL